MCLKAAITRPDAEKVKKANSGTDLKDLGRALSPAVQKRCVLCVLSNTNGGGNSVLFLHYQARPD